MAKLHFVKKARKSIKGTPVKRGMSYWWWKPHIRAAKRVSLTKPRRSQYLTQSPFLGSLMDMEDDLENVNGMPREELTNMLEEMADALEQLAEECEASKESVAEEFGEDNPTAELLRTRAEFCSDLAGDLRSLASDDDPKEGLADIDWGCE
jgi:hypothetical protein